MFFGHRRKRLLRIIKQARQSIEDPSSWNQGAFASTASGHMTNPYAANAASWCALGAISRALYIEHGKDYSAKAKDEERILKIFKNEVLEEGQTLIRFNDAPSRKHGEVIAAFDKVAAKLEKA